MKKLDLEQSAAIEGGGCNEFTQELLGICSIPCIIYSAWNNTTGPYGLDPMYCR